MLDLIIIGAGPAGITATVYAARKRMELLVITGDIGGQAAWSGDIENYTGYQFISGPELVLKFEEHMRKYGSALRENEKVTNLEKIKEKIVVRTDKGVYEAKTAIIASGKRSRELNVLGEKEFKNKGISYCATCDGPLFSGKKVAIIGGGNSALDAALQLIKIAKQVYIINNSAELSGDAVMQEKLSQDSRVIVFNNAKVTAITGDKFVTGLRLEKADKEEELAVGGIFIEIGLVPNSEFATSLEKNQLKEIKVDRYNQTSVPVSLPLETLAM